MGGPLDHLSDLVRSVTSSSSLDEALGQLADELSRLGAEPRVLIVGVFDGDDVVVASSWSSTATFFAPGMRIAPTLTPEMEAAVTQIKRGVLLELTPDMADFGIVGDLWASEGLQSLVVIPFRDREEVVGLIGIGSALARGFREIELVLFDAFGRGVGAPLLRLVPDPRALSPPPERDD